MKFWNKERRLIACNALLATLIATVAYSGFAYPLHYGSGAWPFNRDWFMFSYDTGYDYEMQAMAESNDGQTIMLDVTTLFRFPSGGQGNRFQEAPRDGESMRKMARFLCAHFPIRTVSLNDLSWIRIAGPHLSAKDIPSAQISTTNWVDRYQCGS